jgi:hypothetical protein
MDLDYLVFFVDPDSIAFRTLRLPADLGPLLEVDEIFKDHDLLGQLDYIRFFALLLVLVAHGVFLQKMIG